MSGFDPDAYLASKQSNDFDPDAYLGKDKMSGLESFGHGVERAASLGFWDELAGATEGVGQAIGLRGLGGPIKDVELQSPNLLDTDAFAEAYRERRDKERAIEKEASDTNPKSFVGGQLLGGLATAKIPLGAARGISGMAKTGAVLGGATGLGSSESDDASGMALDTAKGAAIGAGSAAAVGKGLDYGGKLVDKAFNGFKTKYGPLAKEYLDAMTKEKANAPEIRAAANRLGVKPTTGMLKDSERIGKLESSLEQSPSLFGWLVSKDTKKVANAIDQVPKDAFKQASSLSPNEVGETVKRSIVDKVSSRAKELGKPFEELAESTRNIELNPKSLERVGRNMTTLDEVRLMPSSPWASKAKQYAEAIQNAKSVDEVKTIRSLVGKEIENAEGPERQVLGALYDKLSRLEENSMMRGAIDQMRSMARAPKGKTGDAMAKQGEEIGLDMINQLRSAKSNYRGFNDELRSFADEANLGRTSGPSGFKAAIDNMQSEKVADKLFNLGNLNGIKKLQSSFPQEAELLRQARLGSMQRQSSDPYGNISRAKFFNQVKNQGDDALAATFGQKDLSKIKDARFLANEVPDMVGPSGTPQGLDYAKGVLNPLLYAKDAMNYMAYKGVGEKSGKQLAEILLQSPRFQKMATENPQAFKALVIDMSSRAKPAPQLPKAAGSELDNDSSTPANQRIDENEAKQKFINEN